MPIFLVWAYHSTSDTLQQHDNGTNNRGFREVTLIPAVTSTTSTMMMMMMMTTSMTTTTPTPDATGKFKSHHNACFANCKYTLAKTRGVLCRIHAFARSQRDGRRGGLMVSALGSESNGPGSRPGRGAALCSWARHFTLTVPRGNPSMD